MPSCAVGTCDGQTCLCADLRRRFPPVVACGIPVNDGQDECVLVKGHPRWVKCRAKTTPEKVDVSTRDGEPKLAAARERGNPAFQKRHRAGPNWVPPARRV